MGEQFCIQEGPKHGCLGLSSTHSCWTVSFGIRVGVSAEPGRCSRVGALLPMVGVVFEELVLLLRSLRNLISSSTHSSVVRRHAELRTLGSSTSDDEKSVRLKSLWEFPGRD